MALATQCPHCHTTFRVAHDQLKLRAGLVRCGACKQIFNGIENLLRPEDLERTVNPPPAPPAQPQVTPPPVAQTPPPEKKIEVDFHIPDHFLEDEPEEDVEPEETAPPESVANPATEEPPVDETTEEEIVDAASEEVKPKEDPLLRMTLMDIAHIRREPVIGDPQETASARTEAHDPLDEVIEDLNNKPWRSKPDASAQIEADALDQADAADYEEPAFVRQGRRKQRIGRILRIFMATASVILFFGLIAQAAYVFRDKIAAWIPPAKPILAAACAHLGCQVGLPSQIDDVSIESSELQALAADSQAFSLTVLLRNHSATDQAWPHVELTLNDADEKAILRKVFTPREYLPNSQDARKGFAARSEQPVKIFFELSQLKASGYRVYLFYP